MIITVKTPVEEMVKIGSRCDRSNHCCKHSTGFLAQGDLVNLSRHLQIPIRQLKQKFLREEDIFNRIMLRPKKLIKNKPYGRCVFLDDVKGCTVHMVKPLQCKVSTCKHDGSAILQWFYVNHVLDMHDPESVRQYAQFIQFHNPIPGASLEELIPDEEERKRILSYKNFHLKQREDQNQNE